MTKIPQSAPVFDVILDEETIKTSIPKDSNNCMTAMAIANARPDARYISVDVQTIRFSEHGWRYTYITPNFLRVAIQQFEQGILPDPFQFKLGRGIAIQITEAKSKPKLTREEYEPIRRAIIKTQSQQETVINKIAKEAGIASNSITKYLQPHGVIPSVQKIHEILNVAVEQLPGTFVEKVAKEKLPEIEKKMKEIPEKKIKKKSVIIDGNNVLEIGGRPFPVIRAGQRRIFGIRAPGQSRFSQNDIDNYNVEGYPAFNPDE